eukprot:scaffold5943_cov134-Cylindrotheca_fusiformis.AAC.1
MMLPKRFWATPSLLPSGLNRTSSTSDEQLKCMHVRFHYCSWKPRANVFSLPTTSTAHQQQWANLIPRRRNKRQWIAVLGANANGVVVVDCRTSDRRAYSHQLGYPLEMPVLGVISHFCATMMICLASLVLSVCHQLNAKVEQDDLFRTYDSALGSEEM